MEDSDRTSTNSDNEDDIPATTSRKFHCKVCSRSFSTQRALSIHISLGHREFSERRIRGLDEYFECPQCTYVSEFLNYMHVHICSHHADLRNYSITEITFNRDRDRLNEDVQNTPEPLPTKNNKQQRSLEFLHAESNVGELKETKETEPRPHCDVCGEIFDSLVDVARHKETYACGDREEHENSPDANDFLEQTSSEPPRKRACLEESTNEKNGEVADREADLNNAPMKTQLSAKQELNNSGAQISPSKKMFTSSPIRSEPYFRDNDSVASGSIDGAAGQLEFCSLTLVVGMFKRATCNPNEIVAVWCKTLKEDVLITASENPSNTIICVQGLSPLSLTQDGKEIWKKCQKAVFSMESNDGTMTPWTAIFFGDQRPPEDLHGNVFEKFQDVEAVLADYTTNRDMNLVNIMKFGKDGLSPILSKCFLQKTIQYNHHH